MPTNNNGNNGNNGNNHKFDLHDPTFNVLSLVEASIKRIDDLALSEKQHTAELRSVEQLRINAIIESTKEQTISQAAILATQLQSNAESIRLQINNLSERLSVLEKNGNERSGSNLNSKNMVAYLISGITILIAIVAFFIHH